MGKISNHFKVYLLINITQLTIKYVCHQVHIFLPRCLPQTGSRLSSSKTLPIRLSHQHLSRQPFSFPKMPSQASILSLSAGMGVPSCSAIVSRKCCSIPGCLNMYRSIPSSWSARISSFCQNRRVSTHSRISKTFGPGAAVRCRQW